MSIVCSACSCRAYSSRNRGGLLRDQGSQLLQLQSNRIIDGMGEGLFGAEVAFGGLDGAVSEQQLDLLQIPAGLAAELGAGAAQVVRRQPAQLRLLCIAHHQPPDGFFVPHLRAGKHVGLVDRTEDPAGADPGRPEPDIDPGLDRRGNGDDAEPVALPVIFLIIWHTSVRIIWHTSVGRPSHGTLQKR